MKDYIRKYPATKSLFAIAIGIILICGIVLSYRATAEPQRGRTKIPPGPKRGVNYSSFKHSSHSQSCAACHKVKEGERAQHFPGHTACNDCHFFPAFTVGARSYCVVCHTPPGNNAKLKGFPDQRKDQFAIKFPHNVHVGMDVKDYNPLVPVREISEELKKVNAISEKGGCISCHVKEGPQKKETNFSKPYHPECAQCHGDEGKKVAPAMSNCAGCHIAPTPNRSEVSGIITGFRHDRDHERDVRPTAKSKAVLECKFCHNTAVKAKKLIDILPPSADKCTVCHNSEIGARALTSQELAKLSKPAEQAKPNDKTPIPTKPASEKTQPSAKPDSNKSQPAAKPVDQPKPKR
jgi:hypothetical protein